MANTVKKCMLHGVVNNETTDLYPRTNLASVVDMTAFARTLNGAVDAATARNILEIQTSKDIINIIYPVGSVITLTNDTDPNKLYKGTTWVKMEAGRVLVSAGSYTENGTTYTYNLGDKGGEAKHQLTTEELASHTHDATTSTNYANGQFSGMDGTISGVFSKIANQNSNSNFDKPYYDRVAINFEHNHSHNITIGNTGNNAPHENRMPYDAVQRWRRTA